jgi:hypothetical protein
MNNRLLASLSLFVPLIGVSATGFAQTHCAENKGEITHFSCRIANSNKVASLCGGYGSPNNPATEWLQYRFGTPGRIEFTYPSTKPDSMKAFEGVYYVKYSYISYLFINAKALYEIELSEGNPRIFGIIKVVIDKKEHQLRCSKSVAREYWDSLIHLSDRTFQDREGENGFQYRYYNSIAK